MDVTTVKLHKETKVALDAVRTKRESYDQVISRLIAQVKKKNLKKELIECYKARGKEDLSLLEEWENASMEVIHGKH